jgi:hypothetical protein
MHRTNAVNNVANKFVDENPPTTSGTPLNAGDANAWQEEIAMVIERAGLTLRADYASDEAAGWGQLEEAIFDSEALGNGAISDVSIDKLTAGGAITSSVLGGTTYGLNIGTQSGMLVSLDDPSNTVNGYSVANISARSLNLLYRDVVAGNTLNNDAWDDDGFTMRNDETGSETAAARLTSDKLRFDDGLAGVATDYSEVNQSSFITYDGGGTKLSYLSSNTIGAERLKIVDSASSSVMRANVDFVKVTTGAKTAGALADGLVSAAPQPKPRRSPMRARRR